MKRAIWVTGWTKYTNRDKIANALSTFPPGSVVVTGQAAGADTLADELAVEMGMMRVRVPYAGHLGRAGGPVRNELIAKIVMGLAAGFGVQPVCLAFGGDAGTDGSVAIATRLGFYVQEYDR